MSYLDEILGDDGDTMFVGDVSYALGEDEILGALARGAGGAALAKQVALARAAGGGVVGKKQQTNWREQYLPFQGTPADIAIAGTPTFTAKPQRLMRLRKLVISSAQAPSLNILQLNIGADPQFGATGAIPAAIASEVGVGLGLKGTSAPPGIEISLQVSNISGVIVPSFTPGIVADAVY